MSQYLTGQGWVSNDPEATKALRAADNAYESARQSASRLPFPDAMALMSAAKAEHRAAYAAVAAREVSR